MATIRLLTLWARPEGISYPGDVVQVDDQTAEQMARSGQAELIEPAAVVTATAEPQVEHAVRPRASRR